MSHTGEKIAYVNGLRGLAIIMVVWHHLYGQHTYDVEPSLSKVLQAPLDILAASGWLGVNIFFVLSGFVLYLPFTNKNKEFDSRGFLIRRAKRILPLYYLNVAVCIILMAHFEKVSWALKHGILYLFAALPSPLIFFPPYNPPLWSLGIEIWFSVIFPLFFIILKKFSFSLVISSCIVLSMIFHFYGMIIERDSGSFLNPVSDTLPGRLSDFMIGMYAAMLWANNKLLPVQEKFINILSFSLIALALVGSDAWFRGALPAWTQTAWNFCLATGIAGIIIGLKSNKSWSLLRVILEIMPLQIIGIMCFSIYIWHWQLIELVSWVSGKDNWSEDPLFVALYLGALLLVSSLSYRFIEFPGRKGFVAGLSLIRR